MNNQLCERMRTHYPPGTRVQLLRMDDPYAPVPSGTRGTVTHVDDMGQLQMRWDTDQFPQERRTPSKPRTAASGGPTMTEPVEATPEQELDHIAEQTKTPKPLRTG